MTAQAAACGACAARGKTWEGSDPVCGWNADGSFNPDNWNCASLNALRQIAEAQGLHMRDDEAAGSVGVVRTDEGYIVLTWYKARGRTGRAYLMSDDDEAVPLTREVVEWALRAMVAP